MLVKITESMVVTGDVVVAFKLYHLGSSFQMLIAHLSFEIRSQRSSSTISLPIAVLCAIAITTSIVDR